MEQMYHLPPYQKYILVYLKAERPEKEEVLAQEV